MKNAEVANILRDIADLLDLQEDSFKPRAYRRAARSIDQLDEDLEDIALRSELEEIPGVGKAIAQKIQEMLETGKIEYLDRLKGEIAPGLVEMLKIPDVGPKTVRVLHQELGITTVEELHAAVADHKVRELPGFGPRSEEKLQQNLELMMEYQQRLFIGKALPIAEGLIQELQQHPDVEEISVAGSLRRWRETIGDIDILIASKNPLPVMKAFIEHDSVEHVLAQGPTKSSIIVQEGIQVDLRVVDLESFGAALQYFTGSKAHNIALRSLARQRGWKLSEYNLMDVKTKEIIAGRKEESIYNALGMDWVPPELREDAGEIEAALKHRIPTLVNFSDIRGDLHVHTNWTDGVDSIEDMAKAAMKMGYAYLGICDHSKHVVIANGLDEIRLGQQIKKIREVDKHLPGIHLLAGIEVDILTDGTLDLSDEILAETDMVLAALHLPVKTKTPLTDLLIAACKNQYVDILAHPTGRIVNQRPAFDIDFKEVIRAAKARKVALEINASNRLDLSADLIRLAKEEGLKFTINTDAHRTRSLNQIRYGIGTARRGWLEAHDILNTSSYKKLRTHLKHPH